MRRPSERFARTISAQQRLEGGRRGLGVPGGADRGGHGLFRGAGKGRSAGRHRAVDFGSAAYGVLYH